MKKIISLIVPLSFCALNLSAQLITDIWVDDNYIGGVPGGHKTAVNYVGDDVIGASGTFGLTGARLIYDSAADSMIVQVHGNYFDDLLANNSSLSGTSMGDLFISLYGLEWESGDDTTEDYFNSAFGFTEWDYAVRLGTYDNVGGNKITAGEKYEGKIHEITDADSQIELSYSPPNYIFRTQQEVRVSDGAPETGHMAHWYISEDKGYLGFEFEGFSAMLNSFGGQQVDTVGFHWTMTCGNDVLEFAFDFENVVVPVPEPSLIGGMAVIMTFGGLALRRRLLRNRGKRA